MTLSKVVVQNGIGATLELPFRIGESSMIIESINGLDPVKATLVSSDRALIDGSQFQASRRESRDINLNISIVPSIGTVSVQSVRKRLYGFLMPKTKVKLIFTDDGNEDYVIDGYVESFETSIFTKDPSVDVGIVCFDPDFYTMNPVVLNGTSGTAEKTYTYDGDVSTGVKLTMKPTSAISEFTFTVKNSIEWISSLVYQSPLAAGDVLVIETTPGRKSVMLTRASDKYTLSTLYGISPSSQWVKFAPGDNLYTIDTGGISVPYTLEFTPKYGGL